jgi:hypothetical protein
VQRRLLGGDVGGRIGGVTSGVEGWHVEGPSLSVNGKLRFEGGATLLDIVGNERRALTCTQYFDGEFMPCQIIVSWYRLLLRAEYVLRSLDTQCLYGKAPRTFRAVERVVIVFVGVGVGIEIAGVVIACHLGSGGLLLEMSLELIGCKT